MNPNNKRKQTPRSRRAQYINQACNQCQRRKVKCDGGDPCQRCLAREVACTYLEPSSQRVVEPARPTALAPVGNGERPSRPSDPSAPAHISLDNDTATAAAYQRQPPESANSLWDGQTIRSPRDAGSDPPEFCGPSSSEHALNVVSGNLKAMGIPASILEKPSPRTGTSLGASSGMAHYGPLIKLLAMDPLWEVRKQDAIDLINNWCDGVGSLYPVVTHAEMLKTAGDVFEVLQTAQRDGPFYQGGLVMETLLNDDTNKLKIVLAIGLTLKSGGRNDQAQRLFQSITEVVEGMMWHPNGIHGIRLLVLVALFHYHLDDEARTGRFSGFAARFCLEMGLHRRDTLEKTFPNPEERAVALRAFWSVYMLERRTSLGLGLPFFIQDSYIDPSLFALDSSSSILPILLQWTKLAGSTWKALNGHGERGAELKLDELDFINYKILHWYDQLPGNLKISQYQGERRRQNERLAYHQVILFVRKSHLLNLIFRPVLQSSSRINLNQQHAETAIKVAKEAIVTLSELRNHTAVIQGHAIFFKHLVLTAFGNLLLAVVNASGLFWDSVRNEFDNALDLIKHLSTQSAPVMRLWKRLEGLRDLQSKLLRASGVTSSNNNQSGNQYDSLGGLSLEELFPPFATIGSLTEPANSFICPANDAQMREQVNSLFDASVGFDSFVDFPFAEWEQNQ